MINATEARFDMYSNLEKKYADLLEIANESINIAIKNGEFKTEIATPNMPYEEKRKFKRLLEHYGYIVNFHYIKENTLSIEW